MSDSEAVRLAQNLVQFGLVSPSRLSSVDPYHFYNIYNNYHYSYDSASAFTSRSYQANREGAQQHSTRVSRRASRRQESTSSRRTQPIAPPQRPQLRHRMTGMLDIDRSYNRRGDRTFAGGRCAVCEEPLEHTLRGERFLQLTCSHVAHEACFYQLLGDADSQHCPECGASLGLDPGRGGNVVNLEKLSHIVRSLQPNPYPPQYDQHHHQPQSPRPWDPRPPDYASYPQQPRSARYDYAQPHTRDTSNGTVRTVTASDVAVSSAPRRRHDHGSSVDTDVPVSTTRASFPRNPIPAPLVNLRSEYPTMTRSQQPQSLTCLVTVEVRETNVRPHFGRQHTLQNVASTISEPVHESRPPTPPPTKHLDAEAAVEKAQEMATVAKGLHNRVDNWHGLDFSRFGPLRLHNKLQVGKDARSWQELECYLFSEMLICVKEKKVAEHVAWDDDSPVPRRTKATLKGSIMIKRHLESVETSPDNHHRLSLNLSVPELPLFHLQFPDELQLLAWERALNTVHAPDTSGNYDDDDQIAPVDDEDDEEKDTKNRDISSVASTYAANKSSTAIASESTDFAESTSHSLGPSLHAPIDLVLIVPVNSSMAGIKIENMRDSIRFLVGSLGPRDRLALVAVGAASGVNHAVGLTTKTWPGWTKVLDLLQATKQRASAKDLVEGANAAMDVLMQRKTVNPISSIFVVSDSSSSDSEGLDFVVQRAEAAKVSIYTFGFGIAHKPDSLVDLATKTESSYTYMKDWFTLRDCLGGCLGSLQTTSHQSVKLKLHLPEGAPVKFAKLSGALHVQRRAGGRDAECNLGDLRYGDKRDILVTLTIVPESTVNETEAAPQDAWDSMVSNLEALGGSLDQDSNRVPSIEEVPVLQAELVYGDVLHNGSTMSSPRQSLLTITMLAPPSKQKVSRPQSVIPPHASIVQRRMELLTSDMLTKALQLHAHGLHDKVPGLLQQTRSILKGYGKAGQPPPLGSLPPLPPSRAGSRPPPTSPPNASFSSLSSESTEKSPNITVPTSPHPLASPSMVGVDHEMVSALDSELEAALEWITHATVFARDARKAALQAIDSIISQRAYTTRTPLETIWANRISGIRDMAAKSRDWRKDDDVA